jgi:Cu+-exporting ATPase
MLGAAAMSMSSVFVVSNALRLRLFRPKNQISCTCADNTAAPAAEIIKEEITMETVIKVEGMMCKHCKAHVEKACMGVAGTVSAEVDLTAKNVTVIGTASKEALTAAITEAGYDVVD